MRKTCKAALQPHFSCAEVTAAEAMGALEEAFAASVSDKDEEDGSSNLETRHGSHNIFDRYLKKGNGMGFCDKQEQMNLDILMNANRERHKLKGDITC
jgi:hypothetical protein